MAATTRNETYGAVRTTTTRAMPRKQKRQRGEKLRRIIAK